MKNSQHKPAFSFAGQGSQQKGMGRALAEASDEAMQLWKLAEKASGLNLRGIYWEGSDAEMANTAALQPALTVVNLTIWNASKIAPFAVAGHSLGEFSALAASGALSIEDALILTSLRGRLMAEANGGAMAAIVKLPVQTVTEIARAAADETGQLVVCANYNTPKQTVLSGERAPVELACQKAKEQGGRGILLPVSGAFHSPMMEEANRELVPQLRKAEWRDARFPVYCGVTGKSSQNADDLLQEMEKQMISPVLWTQVIENLWQDGARDFVEIAPKAVLGKMVAPCLPADADVSVELLDGMGAIAMRAKDTLVRALEKDCGPQNLSIPAKHVLNVPKDARFGDLSSNLAMLLAHDCAKDSRALAKEFACQLMDECGDIAKAEAAGPGFCNITFKPAFWQGVVQEIEQAGNAYGNGQLLAGTKALVEYVSANPTGPLHVGHGRGAAYGDCIARILRAQGAEVGTEYYLNDAGLQMRTLGLSILLRARELSGQEIDFPKDCYQGEYIRDIAREALSLHSNLAGMREDEAREICQQLGMDKILAGIKGDLLRFRCEHQRYFSEKSLVQSGAVDKAFAVLDQAGRTFHEDGAYWFRTSDLGDDRDRVLRKSDGSLTYFATDIAYHHDKFARGHDWLIDVWGADHHGYVPRMRAGIEALGENPEKFSVQLIQLVNLLRDGAQVSMSTRAGTFVTLSDVLDEVGVDAARFMFMARKNDSPLDFDLEVLKTRSLDNPVYYVQYAHARICALLRRAGDRGVHLPAVSAPETLALLDTPEDLAIMRQLALFEDVTANAARDLAPHYITTYLRELAALLHSYYVKHQILLADDPQRTLARLALSRAVGQVVKNGLFLLGVSAPEQM